MPPINESVKAVMRVIRRKLGTAQKGKAPATAPVVAKLVKRIPDDLSGKRDKALILIGFAAAFSRSELVALMARQALVSSPSCRRQHFTSVFA